MDAPAQEILEFWRGIGPKGWFARDAAVDAEIAGRFGETHRQAAAGAHAHWQDQPQTCLALVLLLDQFPRNMFRGDPRAFATDALALAAATDAIARGFHARVEPELGDFFFLPLMHSESIADQEHCVRLMHAHSGAQSLRYARLHRDVIVRFGRFPHRNPMLGRYTTPAESAFLAAGGFTG